MSKVNNLLVLCFLFLLVSPISHAHNFWLEPENFQVDAASTIPIKFQIGHKGHASAWYLSWDRVVAIRQYHATGVSDMSASVRVFSDRERGGADAVIQNPGTVIVGFESYHSVSELNAERFNQYAKKEGLKRIIAARVASGSQNKPGREIYSRKAKSIIQAGEATTDNVLEPIGHTLEIVPITHPYKSSQTDAFLVKLMFKGEPLANAKLRLAALDKTNIADVVVSTNNDGIAEFSVPRSGKWMFTSVWGVPLQNNDRAEFETYFSSLTIGY